MCRRRSYVCAWKSLPKRSHCDLFGRLGCTSRLFSNLSIRGGLGGFSPLRCSCCFLRKLASLWHLWLCVSRLCQRFSLLNTMLWNMAGIQLQKGRPSVPSQSGVPFGTQGYSQFSSESVPKVCMKMFRRSRCSRIWRMASFTTTIYVRVETWWLHGVCGYFWSDGSLNHSCTMRHGDWSRICQKKFIRNIIYKSTITNMVTLGSSSCAHHQGVLGSGFMASHILKFSIRWG